MIEPKCNDYTMEHHHCLHHLQVSLQFEETFQTEFVGSGFSKENCECSRFSKMGHEQPKLHLGLRNPSHTFCGKSRFRLESPCVQVGILGRGEHPKTFKSKVFWVNTVSPRPGWCVPRKHSNGNHCYCPKGRRQQLHLPKCLKSF